jgi:glycosyltransferase involved in cell wall biosynthesis
LNVLIHLMSFLQKITPVVLTYNEGPNIGRCLQSLTWANQALVVDSFSDDQTLAICADFPNVRVVQRHYDVNANQWNFAIRDAGVATDWVLALDADYLLTENFVHELSMLSPSAQIAGYLCAFRYAIFGKPLRSGIYPSAIALFRRERSRYVQDGHTQRVIVNGALGRISAPILHDDRKPFARWLDSQLKYATLERNKIETTGASRSLGLKDWLRSKTPFSPIAVGLYCLLVRGGILEGRAGLYYALQRMAAEAIISAAIFDARLRAAQEKPSWNNHEEPEPRRDQC